MQKEEVLALLRSRWPELRALGVAELYLFGSLARGEARPGSDVDLLVVFLAPPGFEGYWRVKEFLESLLGRPVDLVMKGALKPWAASEVLREAVRVA
ncbi:nucleotidyltransferase family protein [Thermus sp. FJN-A]